MIASPFGAGVHPASRHLASESRHIEAESAEHDLHGFHAWRRMDELLVDDFEVFHDVVREDRYDLWIGDGARSTPSCTRTLYEHLAACGIDGARRAALRLAELL